MTGFDAIEEVKTVLENTPLSLSGGIYQFSKPLNKEEDEFIEINSLALPETILQNCNVNANIYVNDIVVGTPDNGRMKALTKEVKAAFPYLSSDGNIDISVRDTDIIPDIDNSRHYVNVRLQVMMLNE